MVRITQVNWCTRYNHEVDYELVHKMKPPCIKEHKGCGNCPNVERKVFQDGMQMNPDNGSSSVDDIVIRTLRSTMDRPTTCVICGKVCVQGKITCCDDHHEELIMKLEAKLGQYKKVLSMETGKAHRVPLRDIVERGLKHKDLKKYPEWTEH
uniref:Uncharacterized protein n=1 Tax=viral metagenome TaxID=1070528 RepID=A0A6M3X5Y7_9ZZZZ